MSSLPSSTLAAVEQSEPAYQRVIDEICNLNWANLSDEDVIKTADWKESFRQSSQHSSIF